MTRRRESELDDTVVDPALTVELAQLVLPKVAPDELPVLDDSVEEYFSDPAAALDSGKSDTPLGAGIDVAMMTPYVLSVVSATLPVLGALVGDIAKDVVKDLVKEPVLTRVRALFKRRPDELPGPSALSPDQAAQVRAAVVRHCYSLGLPSAQAALLADATVGTLHVRP